MKIRFDYNQDIETISNLEISLDGVEYKELPIKEDLYIEDVPDAIYFFLKDKDYQNWLEI